MTKHRLFAKGYDSTMTHYAENLKRKLTSRSPELTLAIRCAHSELCFGYQYVLAVRVIQIHRKPIILL